MIQWELADYSLPSTATNDLENADFGKLRAVRTQDAEAADFTVLDCFDQPLRQSGRLLLETGKTLELLMANGRVLTQPGRRTGNFVIDLSDGPVKQALADLSALRSLLPVGSGEMRRETLTLVDDVDKVQCRAQLRFLTTTDGGMLLVVLQGLRGYDKARAQLRKTLESAGAIALEEVDVYSRLFPGHPRYLAKPEVAITPDMAAFDAANDIIAAYIPVARANESGIAADHDTAFLHDYRIALRKIRAVLSLFKGIYGSEQTDDLKARFSALMAVTGRVRDLDVYLLEQQKYYDLLPQSLHAGLDTLFSHLASERAEMLAKLAEHLRSKSYDKEFATLAKLFGARKKLTRGPKADLSAKAYASALIWKRYHKVCKIASAIDADTTDTEVHALRIHCKKLRYLMEFFAPLFPQKQINSLLKPLKRLQDNLGLFNDYAVQQDSLSVFLRQFNKPSQTGVLEMAQSIGALIAILHRRQMEERVRALESFAQFDSTQTRQTFRKLFKGGLR
jgi:CHAD domain-containing protein